MKIKNKTYSNFEVLTSRDESIKCHVRIAGKDKDSDKFDFF